MPTGYYDHPQRHGHGKKGGKPSRTYNSWTGMRRRCLSQRAANYARYGGRGIRVCERWATSFLHFLADMGERPSAAHQLDRIDNQGHYEPGNCRWATVHEQRRNTRQTVAITIEGRTMCLTDWAREAGMPARTLHTRIRNGWDPKRAISAPRWSRKAAA